MATSGSSDFNVNRTKIVKRALRILTVIEAGEEPSAEDSETAVEALDAMIKEWQADGAHLWKDEEATLFLTAGTSKYSLGTSGDNAAVTSVKTELAVAGSATDTTIDVDAITGLSSGDAIGIVLDDGTVQWTTINGAPAGATVTLTDALTGAAAIDNHVYAYTSKLPRPLKVTGARRRDSAGTDTPMTMWSRQEYFDTPNKTSTGVPTAFYYDPQLTTGEIHIWPAPDTANDRIMLTVQVPIEDMDDASNTADFPQEWLSTLAFGLAVELMYEYAVSPALADRVRIEAGNKKERLLGWDSAEAAVYFTPDLEYGQ